MKQIQLNPNRNKQITTKTKQRGQCRSQWVHKIPRSLSLNSKSHISPNGGLGSWHNSCGVDMSPTVTCYNIIWYILVARAATIILQRKQAQTQNKFYNKTRRKTIVKPIPNPPTQTPTTFKGELGMVHL